MLLYLKTRMYLPAWYDEDLAYNVKYTGICVGVTAGELVQEDVGNVHEVPPHREVATKYLRTEAMARLPQQPCRLLVLAAHSCYFQRHLLGISSKDRQPLNTHAQKMKFLKETAGLVSG